jgi:hypothetical protein
VTEGENDEITIRISRVNLKEYGSGIVHGVVMKLEKW